jgi:hypothetical protein
LISYYHAVLPERGIDGRPGWDGEGLPGKKENIENIGT